MKKLNEEGIIIHDQVLANKYLQAQRAINDRLKKKAQLDKEIVVYKQQMAEVEKQSIKKQQATIKATKPQQQQQQEQPELSMGDMLQAESFIPTLEDFLKEEEEN